MPCSWFQPLAWLGLKKPHSRLAQALAVVLTSKVQGERRETAEEQRHRTANTGTNMEGVRGGQQQGCARDVENDGPQKQEGSWNRDCLTLVKSKASGQRGSELMSTRYSDQTKVKVFVQLHFISYITLSTVAARSGWFSSSNNANWDLRQLHKCNWKLVY